MPRCSLPDVYRKGVQSHTIGNYAGVAGAGVGTRFLNEIMQYHLEGNGRKGYKYPTFFHTSHPQLAGYLRYSDKWLQTNAVLYGGNKTRSNASLTKTGKGLLLGTGYGGHFRAVQSFKYIGNEKEN